jgi:hypothetical protein
VRLLILASTAFALVHNNLMISAMHPVVRNCLYLSLLDRWENSAFFGAQEQGGEGNAGTVIGRHTKISVR